MLKKTDVAARIHAIRNVRDDDETAHDLEDALYLETLTAIATGNVEDARAVARVAITTQRIKFARHRA